MIKVRILSLNCALTDNDIEEILAAFNNEQKRQRFTSRNTSINKANIPELFSKIRNKLEPGSVNLDYGGGKFDNVAEYLEPLDVMNLIYDPFNRDEEHNRKVLSILRDRGGADTVTMSNVLNVIETQEHRLQALDFAKRMLKDGGTIYIKVHEGSKRDRELGSRQTKDDQYQLFWRPEQYLEEIRQYFPNAEKGSYGIITATK